MFWQGVSCKNILADVNESKEVPDRYLPIVYNFGRLREPILESDHLVTTTFSNSLGGCLRELRLYIEFSTPDSALQTF